MIPKVCDLCQVAGTDKLASLYWAVNNSRGDRQAWLQKVCSGCFQEAYGMMVVRAVEPVLICPSCGIGTADDYQAVYLTYCVPGRAKEQSEFPFCGACADMVVLKARLNSRPLEDRGVGAGGPSTGPQPSGPQDDPWSLAGLRLRE